MPTLLSQRTKRWERKTKKRKPWGRAGGGELEIIKTVREWQVENWHRKRFSKRQGRSNYLRLGIKKINLGG